MRTDRHLDEAVMTEAGRDPLRTDAHRAGDDDGGRQAEGRFTRRHDMGKEDVSSPQPGKWSISGELMRPSPL